MIVEGTGRSLLVLHGGMGDQSSWAPVTDHLREHFRVARLHRRQYRLDVPRKVTMADEVAEVLAVAETLESPVIVGHSSGAVLALESLVAAPPGLFSAAVLYEPPLLVDDRPLGDGTQVPGAAADATPAGGIVDGDAAPSGTPAGGTATGGTATGGAAAGSAGRPVDRARAALAEGKPGTAFATFLAEIAGIGRDMAAMIEATVNEQPAMAPIVERQLDDNDAIDALGNRLAAYSKIDRPVLLITGDQSPRHLRERLGALQAVLPDARRVTLAGEGHNAERTSPDRLAEAISEFVRTARPTS
jgi:pimeloyl-ACP methyl ester carboxylesterase